MLTGDSTDNIKGCPGIGNKKAEEIIKNRNQVLDIPNSKQIIVAHPIHQIVLNTFVETLGVAKGIEAFSLSFRLVYLLEEYDSFSFPTPIISTS